MDALEVLEPFIHVEQSRALGRNMHVQRLLNDCERYVWRCSGCVDPAGRHVVVRQLYPLVRAYQERERRVPGNGLSCIACRACYAQEDVFIRARRFFGSRKPSTSEQRLYDLLQRVFPCNILSLEHHIPGESMSVDVMLLERSIACQADGDQHRKTVERDLAYDARLRQQGISVVRLFCGDDGWLGILEEAKQRSDAGECFCLYSPSYEAWL